MTAAFSEAITDWEERRTAEQIAGMVKDASTDDEEEEDDEEGEEEEEGEEGEEGEEEEEEEGEEEGEAAAEAEAVALEGDSQVFSLEAALWPFPRPLLDLS